MQDACIVLGVLATFMMLNLLPLWLPARRWLAPGPWPVTAAATLLLSFATQSVCGLIWSRWIRVSPVYEGTWFLGFCAAFSLLAILWPRQAQPTTPTLTSRESGWLGFILIASLIIRSLHPLQHWGLGQSDAYTHLKMIRQLLIWGFIGNESYPSGFAWIMSLPATSFGWDPYYLARFGGAFFGTVLVIAVYALLRIGSGSGITALSGAALVAWFPGLMLLIKTGVGAFANQVGIAALPLVLLGYLWVRAPETRWRGLLWLMIGFICLALTVPMMMLHLFGVLALVLLLDGPWTCASVWRRVLLMLLLISIAISLLAIQLMHMTPWQCSKTALILTYSDQSHSPVAMQPEALTSLSTLSLLAHDFFSVKRWGLQAPLLDATLIGLLLLFIVTLIWGLRRRQIIAIMLGCWGGLACIQVATGWLQFTTYQREGWSLLIAIGVLGGFIIGELWAWSVRLRSLMLAGLILSGVWTFAYPPEHRLLNSSAEEELIRAIRLIRNFPAWATPSDPAISAFQTFLTQKLDPALPVEVCSRSLIQPDVFQSVAGFNSHLLFHRVVWKHPLAEYMDAGKQFLVVLDEPEDLSQYAFGIFGSISPALKNNFIDQQQKRYATNHDMETYLAGLPRDQWDVSGHAISPRLRMIVARRIDSPSTP